jgi:sec-independent protein translocase protein TatB
MFDFGFSELLVIGVVLLVVVGPERLPKVARTAGHLLGRLQRYVSDVKSDIQREIQLDELKKLQEQVQQQARELETSVKGQVSDVESGLRMAEQEMRATVGEVQQAAAPQSSATPRPLTGEGPAPASAPQATGSPSSQQPVPADKP